MGKILLRKRITEIVKQDKKPKPGGQDRVKDPD